MSKRDQQHLLPEGFFYSYLLILCWAPLPLGSNRPWAWMLLAAASMLLAAGALWYLVNQRLSLRPFFQTNRLALILLALPALWASIQGLPLPYELVQLLSPNAAELQQAAGSQTFSLSLEAARSQQMALLSWAYWLFFALTLLLIDSRRRVKTLLTAIVFCGVFQAFYGSLMTLTGLEYGFFVKKAANLGNATGTFVNRNHLAGYLEMCLAAGIGLLVASLNKHEDVNWQAKARSVLDLFLGSKIRLRVYLAIMVIALVLTNSRMGNAAFFTSLGVCGLLMMVLRKRVNKNAIILFASLLLIDFLIFSQWFGLDELAQRIQTTSVDAETRDEVIRDAWTMLQDYPLTGTGAGTFYSSFPRYSQSDITGYYDHAHNDYIEFFTNLGMIGFIPLGLSVAFALATAIRTQYRRRERLMICLGFASGMGILSLLIHSAVDFNLQIPANALLFVVFLALAQIASKLKIKREITI